MGLKKSAWGVRHHEEDLSRGDFKYNLNFTRNIRFNGEEKIGKFANDHSKRGVPFFAQRTIFAQERLFVFRIIFVFLVSLFSFLEAIFDKMQKKASSWDAFLWHYSCLYYSYMKKVDKMLGNLKGLPIENEKNYMGDRKMKLKVVLKSRDEGGFKAYVPALPDCFSKGLTQDEALKGIEHSILFHFGIEQVSYSRINSENGGVLATS